MRGLASIFVGILNQVLNLGGALVRSDPTDALGLGDTTQACLEDYSAPTHRTAEKFRDPLGIMQKNFDAHSWCKIFMYRRVK